MPEDEKITVYSSREVEQIAAQAASLARKQTVLLIAYSELAQSHATPAIVSAFEEIMEDYGLRLAPQEVQPTNADPAS